MIDRLKYLNSKTNIDYVPITYWKNEKSLGDANLKYYWNNIYWSLDDNIPQTCDTKSPLPFWSHKIQYSLD